MDSPRRDAALERLFALLRWQVWRLSLPDLARQAAYTNPERYARHLGRPPSDVDPPASNVVYSGEPV